MVICSECPRRCRAVRKPDSGEGFCKMGTLPRVARIAPHYGEEPCISGTHGTAAVFFSGCSLGCVFCQNERISHEGFGRTLTTEELRARIEPVAARCDTVSLVNPTHYTHLLPALLREPFGKPVVYNSGGYDSVSALRALEGRIDVYLPDLKYRSARLSERYSAAADYFEVASAAILEMVRQTGPFRMGEDGILQRGVMIRHLVLPGYSADSIAVLRWCRDHLPSGSVLYSVMSQYTPYSKACAIPALNRRVTAREYGRVTDFLSDNEMLDGYIQELSSAGTDAIPDFDALDGVR
ncbi:MAG: radical SAM protein [Clostridiaceae bacterium]|nr:radical SAM protein [Clostridiaceae bacterium]